MKQQFQNIMITPRMAAEWLDRNVANRPLSKIWVIQLRDRIIKGEWRLNGETIKFDSDGNLLDGQHRLAAIVMANKSVMMTVAKELDPSSFDTIDDGRKRKASDVLAINGEKNYKLLSTILRTVHDYEKTGHFNVSAGSKSTITLSNKAIASLIDEYPDARESAKVGSGFSKLPISSSAVGTCHFIFNKINPDDTIEFFSRLKSGEDLKTGSPILSLRDILMTNTRERGVFHHRKVCTMMCVAWNYFRRGKRLHKKTLINAKFEKPI